MRTRLELGVGGVEVMFEERQQDILGRERHPRTPSYAGQTIRVVPEMGDKESVPSKGMHCPSNPNGSG